MRWMILAVALGAAPVAAAELSATDIAAAYAAAGYGRDGTEIIGCNGDNANALPSRYDLQVIDLNIDGRTEVIIGEGNAACYGLSGSSFTIVGRDVGGRWRRLGGTVGVARKLPGRRLGWADIAAVLPGPGKPRVLRWTGTEYR